jgi:regulator of ribosome biosynthesis
VRGMDVEEILQSKFKSIEVSKETQLQYDMGHLMALDFNDIDATSFKERKELYLHELIRDNTQLLVNELWKQPIERSNDVVTVQLPSPNIILPREKLVPKDDPLTKWEKFAKDKGIVKGRRSRMVFDEKSQEWKPRWGYKRIDDPKDEWMIEVPDNADPYDDLFEKRSEARKERIAKNEYQRLRNIAKAGKAGKVKAPLPPIDSKVISKHQYGQALMMSKKATASGGKFTPNLPSEPKKNNGGKKSKFHPVVGKTGEERERNLEILKLMSKKIEIIDKKKAANKLITEEHEV